MALSTFVDLRTELSRRGFDYLSSDRLGNYINNGYSDICEAEDWPFLEATTTGTAPKTVSDLRTIEYVVDTTNQVKLSPIDRRNLTDWTVDLTTTGTPSYYYVTAGSIVNTYPVGTGTLSIHYWKVPTDLSADGDTPVIPSRYRSLIVDAAVVYAYEDDDETGQADAATARFTARLEAMKTSQMVNQHDEPEMSMVARDWGSWGGF